MVENGMKLTGQKLPRPFDGTVRLAFGTSSIRSDKKKSCVMDDLFKFKTSKALFLCMFLSLFLKILASLQGQKTCVGITKIPNWGTLGGVPATTQRRERCARLH